MDNKDYFRGLNVINKEEANIVITGIPYDEGCSCGKGSSLAPKMLKELSSFLPALSMDGRKLRNVKVYINQDIKKSTNQTTEEYFDDIYKKAVEIFKEDKFPLFFGGDHSITIPLEKAFKDVNKKCAIIHLDAHPDILEIYDGSYLSHACTNYQALQNGYVDSEITLIGIRGFEEEEVDFLEKHPDIRLYSSNYIRENGINNILSDLKNRYKDYNVYLSLDIDITDPSFAPGTGTPEAFGISSNCLKDLVIGIIKNVNIKGMDVVEVSPPLDVNNITSWLVLKLLYEIIDLIKR